MTAARYTRPARLLHWFVAALVLIQIALGLASDWTSRETARSLLDIHVQIGLTIFALMVLRLLWRAGHKPPPLPATIDVVQQRIAKAAHTMLYLLLFVMPLSGYALWVWIGAQVRWFGSFTIPTFELAGQDEFWRSVAGYTHEYVGYALIGLILLHIAAALRHEFIERDRLISDRML